MPRVYFSASTLFSGETRLAIIYLTVDIFTSSSQVDGAFNKLSDVFGNGLCLRQSNTPFPDIQTAEQ